MTGVKIWVRAKKPGTECRHKFEHGGEIEIYDYGRYFTMTGWHLEETPSTIEERQEQVNALYSAVFGNEENPEPTTTPKPTGKRRLDLLMAGRLEEAGFKDQISEGVQALLVQLFLYYRERDIVEFKFKESWFWKETHWKKKWERLCEKELSTAEAFARELRKRPTVNVRIGEYHEAMLAAEDVLLKHAEESGIFQRSMTGDIVRVLQLRDRSVCRDLARIFLDLLP
jgi:hypothetical protein